MLNRIPATIAWTLLAWSTNQALSSETLLSLEFGGQDQLPGTVAAEAYGGSDFQARAADDGIRLTASTTLKAGRWGGLRLMQSIAVEPGVTYRLVHESSISQAQHAYSAVSFHPAGGETRRPIPGNTPRTRRAHVFTVPKGASQIAIRFAIDGPTTAWTLHGIRVERTDLQRTELVAPAIKRPHDTVFPRAARPPAHRLTVLDARPLEANERFAAATLQGAVNATKPRVYILWRDTDERWLQLLKAQGHIQDWKRVPDLAALYAEHRGEIRGAIAVDPAVPGTRHVATTLAGIKGKLIACSAEIAQRLKLPIEIDLRGQWQRNIDAYRWLWETHRADLASHVIAWHHPLMAEDGPRDYLLQQRAFTLWVSSPADPLQAADPDAELAFLHELLAATPPAIPVMGWSSYGEAAAGTSEYEALRLLSSYGKYFCGSEFCSNLSLLSGIPTQFISPCR